MKSILSGEQYLISRILNTINCQLPQTLSSGQYQHCFDFCFCTHMLSVYLLVIRQKLLSPSGIAKSVR